MAGITSTLATVASMAPSPAPTPSAVYTPDAACLDASNSANYWMVTTQCYLTDVPYDTPGANILSPPDWLRCTVPMFGVPGYGNPEASTCLAGTGPGYVTGTVAGNEPNAENPVKTYYEGCPSGYGEAVVSSRPGYDKYKYPEGSYDISYYMTTCCPTVYPFQAAPMGLGQESRTSHDGVGYSLEILPMPGCYATSIKQLSGKTLLMQTTSNTQPWEKRQEQNQAAPPTITWDYEKGTLYALPQIAAHTVFMGTHTCYEACSSWMEFYYPEKTGVLGEPNLKTGQVTMARPSESPVPTAPASNDGGGKGGNAPTGNADSGSDGGSVSDEPKDSAGAESANAQSPDVSLAPRLRGEFNIGCCSIIALMIPLMVAILVL